MEARLTPLFEFLGEALLQIFGELLVEIGLRTVKEPFVDEPNPWIAAAGLPHVGRHRRRPEPVGSAASPHARGCTPSAERGAGAIHLRRLNPIQRPITRQLDTP